MKKNRESSVVVCSYSGHFIGAGAVKDIRNVERKRSFFNTCDYYYNCFGYAFQSYLWLQPLLVQSFIDDRREEEGNWYSCEREITKYNYFPIDFEDEEREQLLIALDNNYSDLEDVLDGMYDTDEAIDLIIHNILQCFPDVRLVNSFDELAEDEYGIIMRTRYNDFHFVRYNPKSGRYSAKNGAWEVTHADNAETLFEDGGYYFGETLFAKKRR